MGGAALRKYDVVALLAEGVDRNTGEQEITVTVRKSPSSRRAWIEIPPALVTRITGVVALLAEGVDRNKSHR